MARDCLHPVMLVSHVGTQSLQHSLLLVDRLFLQTPNLGPWLRHRPSLRRSVAACFTASPQCKCVCYFNSVAVQLWSTKEAVGAVPELVTTQTRRDVFGNWRQGDPVGHLPVPAFLWHPENDAEGERLMSPLTLAGRWTTLTHDPSCPRRNGSRLSGRFVVSDDACRPQSGSQTCFHPQ